jgi:2-C-methyl-D-erythritol 4-phosphate cytidylyltransferase/2-C-methyl-D-erythritol 2,4-cyclodiphosphate synthase
LTAISALIPAAGRGKRFGSDKNKVLVEALGRPIIAYTLQAFQACGAVDEIVLVVGEADVPLFEDVVQTFGPFDKLSAVIPGGEERGDSVRRGLEAVSKDIVAIHDGARPLVTEETILATIEGAREFGAAVAAVPVVDTIKQADQEGFVAATLDRSSLYHIQTPQTFLTRDIRKAYDWAETQGISATDDAALYEKTVGKVKLVPGSYDNIKVTGPQDLQTVEAKLQARMKNQPEFRSGIGYDIHRFAPGRRLVLGGIEFDSPDGLLGHSDADVVIHAIMDALLGASALGDIGKLFPNTDPAYKDISSVALLEHVGRLLVSHGWSVVNVDAMMIGERPKIAGRSDEMRSKIAGALGITTSSISIKATTAEGLGYIGSGEGICCYSVATISR